MYNKKLKKDLLRVCDGQSESELVSDFRQRIEEGRFTEQENPESHFCVYFAAFDSESKYANEKN